MPERPPLPRTVLVLGLVSFLNDAASEMVTPLLPLFLTTTLGAGPVLVGLVEGVAEATASLLKLLSGRFADRWGRHKALVMTGYGLANLVRPLIGLATGWGQVLGLRFIDRVGKGVRSAPRDALIAGAVPGDVRGRAFGFHRAMDHAGAMIGPLVAFVLLWYGVPLAMVFLVSAVPGVVLMGLLGAGLPPGAATAFPPPLPYRGKLDNRLRGLVLAAGGLAFASVPDAFLVLWAVQGGLDDAQVPLVWAVAHLARSGVAQVGGRLSDAWGRLPVTLLGWMARVGMLVVLALAPPHRMAVWVLFVLYAATTAFTEGAERALIGDLAPADRKGTLFGFYHMIVGVLALPGALVFGLVWEHVGREAAFCLSAVLTATAAGVLGGMMKRASGRQTETGA